MKVIIAGSRTIIEPLKLQGAIQKSEFDITEVVSGAARGADALGELYAIEHKIPLKRFPANWAKHGKSAGYQRNALMADYADGLIALWDGKSRGTKHMIDLAKKSGLEVFVHLC